MSYTRVPTFPNRQYSMIFTCFFFLSNILLLFSFSHFWNWIVVFSIDVFLLLWHFYFSVGNFLDNVVRVFIVDCTSNGLGGSQDFLAGSGECFGHGSWAHCTSDVDDVVHGDVTIVLYVLHLLPVPGWLFERLYDEWRGWRHHRHFSLSVLDGELYSDPQTLPVLCCFCDVISYFLIFPWFSEAVGTLSYTH